MPLAETDAPADQGPDVGTPVPQAVLWDMDGTLVDTEPCWIAAEQELVEAHGGTWSHEQAMLLFGTPLSVAAEALQGAGVDLSSGQIVDFLISRVIEQVAVEVPWQPGARELLAELCERGVPCALVTMSYRALAEKVVAMSPPDAFGVLVCGDEVTNNKPHPEPYLLAAQRLGVDVTRCVAIEDSPTGIASARAAGAATLGVEAVVPVPVLPGLSRTPSLALVDVDMLSRILAGDVVDLIED
ncbi:HAD family hydrolase [Oerskovia enterophila]|uniref:HAD family hydrolase n=1 Tax=Oerskovia enterophila TaxID=43678 RepID=UPI003396AA34